MSSSADQLTSALTMGERLLDTTKVKQWLQTRFPNGDLRVPSLCDIGVQLSIPNEISPGVGDATQDVASTTQHEQRDVFVERVFTKFAASLVSNKDFIAVLCAVFSARAAASTLLDVASCAKATRRIIDTWLTRSPAGLHPSETGAVTCAVTNTNPLLQFVHEAVPALVAGYDVHVAVDANAAPVVVYVSDLLIEAGLARDKITIKHQTIIPPGAVAPASQQGSSGLLGALPCLGSSTMIVASEADIDSAIEHLAEVAWCQRHTMAPYPIRVLVQEPILESFSHKAALRLTRVRVGSALDCNTDYSEEGPNAEQVDRVLDAAMLDGASVHRAAGDARGRPALVLNVETSSPIMCANVLGPIAVVVGFRSFSEAIKLAKNCCRPMYASVWTQLRNTEVEALVENLPHDVVVVNNHLFQSIASVGVVDGPLSLVGAIPRFDCHWQAVSKSATGKKPSEPSEASDGFKHAVTLAQKKPTYEISAARRAEHLACLRVSTGSPGADVWAAYKTQPSADFEASLTRFCAWYRSTSANVCHSHRGYFIPRPTGASVFVHPSPESVVAVCAAAIALNSPVVLLTQQQQAASLEHFAKHTSLSGLIHVAPVDSEEEIAALAGMARVYDLDQQLQACQGNFDRLFAWATGLLSAYRFVSM